MRQIVLIIGIEESFYHAFFESCYTKLLRLSVI